MSCSVSGATATVSIQWKTSSGSAVSGKSCYHGNHNYHGNDSCHGNSKTSFVCKPYNIIKVYT